MGKAPTSSGTWRTVLLGSVLSGVMILGVVLVLTFLAKPPAPVPAMAAAPATRPVGQATARPPAADYDVVLVSPRGDAVLAGRATPGARIVVRDGTDGAVVGEATANERGEWVLTPGQNLAAGPHTLQLEEHLPDGSVLTAPNPALVSVPERGQGQALAVVAPEGAAPRLVGGAATPTDRPILDTLSYGAGGAVTLSGRAPSGAKLRLYVDNRPVGEAVADAKGNWSLTSTAVVKPGAHRLRIDMLDAAGHVLARADVPFDRVAEGAARVAGAVPGGAITVQPGQSLWRIAASAYGDGVRYVAIFAANRAQIGDPNLIYPGQVFALPEGSIPASSSQSR